MPLSDRSRVALQSILKDPGATQEILDAIDKKGDAPAPPKTTPPARVVANAGSFNLAMTNWFARTLNGANGTLVLQNAASHREFDIELAQDTVGGRTVKWFSGITWLTPGGVEPQPSPGGGEISMFRFKQFGANTYYGVMTGTNRANTTT